MRRALVSALASIAALPVGRLHPRPARRCRPGATGTTSDQSDGGFFCRLARRYEAHPLLLLGA
jgi:hypothetical protein